MLQAVDSLLPAPHLQITTRLIQINRAESI